MGADVLHVQYALSPLAGKRTVTTIHDVSFLTHWGLDVRTREEVDAAHRAAHEYKDHYKIRQITETTLQHGVYSFYLQDLDYNWWEFQYYDGFQDDDVFDFGDRF